MPCETSVAICGRQLQIDWICSVHLLKNNKQFGNSSVCSPHFLYRGLDELLIFTVLFLSFNSHHLATMNFATVLDNVERQ